MIERYRQVFDTVTKEYIPVQENTKITQEMESIKSFRTNQEQVIEKNHLVLRDKEFVIDGYPNIFTRKIDFKDLFRSWGYEPPARITKQMKAEILTLTRDRHLPETLNWKYWNELRGDYVEKEVNCKLF